ncbi:hypothetical protein B0T16DRAFT_458936 [Cercophora newfieldiana]|uniref:G domain-containing protein n=1 Tax=Cercophora newfieldiana TaxID=92897 RepID=A0AA39Y6X5_9PEZI|nr:hypothetical protein B0T16DRAFT_458936 [Cercophora newfieldiana]
MGMTGSGKSTFASRLATSGTQPIGIGNTLSSKTTEIAFYETSSTKNRRVLLADTPGFDDTSRPDTSILQSITLPLFEKHKNGIPVIGIIYLHDITNPRLSGSAVKALKILQDFCGKENYPRIVFATTMWQDAGYSPQGEIAARRRHAELKRDFWDAMFEGNGGVLCHLVDEAGSARKVVDHLLDGVDALRWGDRDRPLKVLREMGGNACIEKTAAYRCAQGEQRLAVQLQGQRREKREGGEREQRGDELLAYRHEDCPSLWVVFKGYLRQRFATR